MPHNETIFTLIFQFAKEFNVSIAIKSNTSIINPGIRVEMSDNIFNVVEMITGEDLEAANTVNLYALLRCMHQSLSFLRDEYDESYMTTKLHLEDIHRRIVEKSHQIITEQEGEDGTTTE